MIDRTPIDDVMTEDEREQALWIIGLDEEMFIRMRPATLTMTEWKRLRELSRKLLASGS